MSAASSVKSTGWGTTGDSAPEKRVPVETYLLEELSKFMSNTLENYPAATYTESVVKVLKGLLLPENYVGVTGHSERIAIMSEVGSDELKSLLEEVDKKVHETAVVFDFGNVLVDWNPDYLYKVQPDYDDIDYQFLREHVLTPDWMTEVDASETMDDLIEAKVHDFPNLEDKIRLFKTNWMEMVKGEVPGMRQLLQEVKQTYRVYGLSNWCKEEFIRAREKYQVLQEVENYVVSGGLCKPDGQKCPPKPSADIYQVFFDQFHLEPKDCFFIDNKQDNVDTALRLGMKAVRFENAEQIRKLLL